MQEVHLQAFWVTGEGDSTIEPALVITKFPWVIGRGAACDSHLENPLVSRRHCAFVERDGEVWVRDLGSQNGTWLNGERVTEARPVRDGDRLEVACLPFLVQFSSYGEGKSNERPASLPAAR
jgi:pSer/pThr/pTyr-binding forkhead associated (FHA) protein